MSVFGIELSINLTVCLPFTAAQLERGFIADDAAVFDEMTVAACANVASLSAALCRSLISLCRQSYTTIAVATAAYSNVTARHTARPTTARSKPSSESACIPHTLKQQSNGPLYSNIVIVHRLLMGGLLHLVQRRGP